MGRFVARRLVQAVVTLLAATFLFFSAITALPGDAVRALFGPSRPPEAVYEAVRAQYHLDEPFLVQYALYLADLARGNLGNSFPNPHGYARQGPPVTSILARALPVSARLVLGTVAVQVVVGIVAGLLAAGRRRPVVSGGVYLGAVAVVSVPVVVLAYVTQSYLGWELGLFPTSGVSQGWRSYVLPVLTLAAASTAYVALLTRSGLLSTMRQRFIRAAEARAVPTRRLVGIHALRPSLLPAIGYIAASAGQLITGLIIVEGIFAVPGIGGQMFFAIQQQDRTMIVSLMTLIAATVILANLLADLLTAAADPRTRSSL
jgi:ABC-type dipeptide/oligopeptide/nickel transport system permease component